jgi:hypothetical protein
MDVRATWASGDPHVVPMLPLSAQPMTRCASPTSASPVPIPTAGPATKPELMPASGPVNRMKAQRSGSLSGSCSVRVSLRVVTVRHLARQLDPPRLVVLIAWKRANQRRRFDPCRKIEL